MASLFKLKGAQSELSDANVGMSEMNFVQYAPSRDVTGANFPGGTQHIKFTTSGDRWWVPYRSYIRMRATMTRGDGTAIVLDSDAAPSMGLIASLFQSMEFRINGTVVSRISDYVAQIDALEKRTSKSKAWLDGVGGSSNFYQARYIDRQQVISSDGIDDPESFFTKHYMSEAEAIATTPGETLSWLDLNTPNQVTFAVNDRIVFTPNGGTAIPDLRQHFKIGQKIFFFDNANKIRHITGFADTNQPYDTILVDGANVHGVVAANLVAQVKTLSQQPKISERAPGLEIIWQPPLSIFKVAHALPAGQYELVLNPQNSNVYERLAFESKHHDLTTGLAAENIKFTIDKMYLYVCQVKSRRVDNMSFLLDLDEITCQKRAVIASTGLQQEEFSVSPSTTALATAFQDNRAGSTTFLSPSLFRIGSQAHHELKLIRFYINYAGDNRPKPDADPSYKLAAVNLEDFTKQRYMDTMIYSNALYESGGCETIQDWHERGAYYYFEWPRDGVDRSTRVIVNYSFNEAISNGSILLFNRLKKVASIKIENGNVVRVQVQEM